MLPASLNGRVKKMRMSSKMMEALIKPRETPKEN